MCSLCVIVAIDRDYRVVFQICVINCVFLPTFVYSFLF